MQELNSVISDLIVRHLYARTYQASFLVVLAKDPIKKIHFMIYIWERDKGQEDNYTTCGRHDRIVR
jgi:hypothetical protein